MGLDANGTQCILFARALGVDLARVAMIGRQQLHLDPGNLKQNLAKFKFSLSYVEASRLLEDSGGFAEEFLRLLGAMRVDSFDNSSYEGATHIHDMNQPIPDSLKGQYSMVLDSGSLEHVFNFPVAIKNCMEMVRVGGHYVGITPANNFMGHGYYQFSPELFFGAFNENNGYDLVCLVAFEDRARPRWHLVTAPADGHDRVELSSSKSIYLFVIAKRVRAVQPFQASPQQSDYVSAWNQADEPNAIRLPTSITLAARPHASVMHMARSCLQSFARRSLTRLIPLRTSFDPRHFEPLEFGKGLDSLDQARRRLALRAESEAMKRRLSSYVVWRFRSIFMRSRA